MEIGNPAGAPLDTRPGLLVVGNLSGDHLLGSALALEPVRHLLAGASDTAIATVLNARVVYVVPRLNPDAAEAMFAAVKQDRSRNARAFDDDNDGRVDEDDAEDLNGDGLVTVMRKPDPSGDFMIHPDNARLMKKADPRPQRPPRPGDQDDRVPGARRGLDDGPVFGAEGWHRRDDRAVAVSDVYNPIPSNQNPCHAVAHSTARCPGNRGPAATRPDRRPRRPWVAQP